MTPSQRIARSMVNTSAVGEGSRPPGSISAGKSPPAGIAYETATPGLCSAERYLSGTHGVADVLHAQAQYRMIGMRIGGQLIAVAASNARCLDETGLCEDATSVAAGFLVMANTDIINECPCQTLRNPDQRSRARTSAGRCDRTGRSGRQHPRCWIPGSRAHIERISHAARTPISHCL
jgi:hypothetical protein